MRNLKKYFIVFKDNKINTLHVNIKHIFNEKTHFPTKIHHRNSVVVLH